MLSKIYGQPGHPTRKLFLSDEERKRAALNMVRLCHDFLPIGPDGKFYLPTRKRGNAISELGGPWFVGGAMAPFTDERVSMQTVLKRELGKEFRLARLVFLRANRYYMNGVAQGAFAHDAYCLVYALPLTAEEIESVKLDPNEYEGGGLQPYDIKKIEEIPDEYVRQIFLDLWQFCGTKKMVG